MLRGCLSAAPFTRCDMKKIISLLFAVTILFAIAALPCFAADATADEQPVVLLSVEKDGEALSDDAVLTIGATESLNPGFDVDLATVLIIVICSVIGLAVIVVCIVLAKRNINN